MLIFVTLNTIFDKQHTGCYPKTLFFVSSMCKALFTGNVNFTIKILSQNHYLAALDTKSLFFIRKGFSENCLQCFQFLSTNLGDLTFLTFYLFKKCLKQQLTCNSQFECTFIHKLCVLKSRTLSLWFWFIWSGLKSKHKHQFCQRTNGSAEIVFQPHLYTCRFCEALS